MPELFAIKVPLDLPSDEIERLLSLLDDSAQARIRKFRLQADQIRSLAGRLSLLWYLLSRGLIASASDVVLGVEEMGKPVIELPLLHPKVYFNISHDGGYVLLGISRTGPIGVDIMAIPTSPTELEEGLYDQMTTGERNHMALPMSDKEKAERLTTLWTIKEAYVKATGQGLGLELDRVEVILKEDGLVDRVCVDQIELADLGWTLNNGPLGAGHGYQHACIWQMEESKGEGVEVDLRVVPWEEIAARMH